MNYRVDPVVCERVAREMYEMLMGRRVALSPYAERMACEVAAANGAQMLLEWAFDEQHCPLGPEACRAAAAHGKLEQLVWIIERGGERWDFTTVEAAWSSRQRSVLEWALENGCPISEK